VVTAEEVLLIDTDDVDSGNRDALGIEQPRLRIGPQPAEGAERSLPHPDGIERSAFDGGQGRIRCHIRVTAVAVERGLSAAELGVTAFAGMPIEFLDRGLERLGVDAALVSEFVQSSRLDEVPGAQEREL